MLVCVTLTLTGPDWNQRHVNEGHEYRSCTGSRGGRGGGGGVQAAGGTRFTSRCLDGPVSTGPSLRALVRAGLNIDRRPGCELIS